MLETLKSGKYKAGEKVLIVLPSSMNTKLIVDNILRMEDFTNVCDLKAIITKINMSNFYHNDHKEICENFLTCCNAGYSQFIILDNYGAEEKVVDRLTFGMTELYQYCKVYRINSNIIQEHIA